MNKMEGFAFIEYQTLGQSGSSLCHGNMGFRCLLWQVQGAHIHLQIHCALLWTYKWGERRLQCYLDAYERLILIGFRFIWSVRPCPLTFPLAWQAARPSCCCYTQASWSVATGHIKNQGCRTRQAGRKKEESVAMPMRKTEKSPQLFRLPLKASEWSESDLLVKMKHSLQSTSLR